MAELEDEFFTFIKDFCTPYKDLTLTMLGRNHNVLEIRSAIFYLNPFEDSAETEYFQAVVAKAFKTDRKLVISVLTKTLCEVLWDPADVDEMCQALKTLSFYGDRHLFCPGLSEETVNNLKFGSRTSPPEHIVGKYELPYVHYRAPKCLLYFQRSRKMRNSQNPVHLCKSCTQVKKNYRLRGQNIILCDAPHNTKYRKICHDETADPLSLDLP